MAMAGSLFGALSVANFNACPLYRSSRVRGNRIYLWCLSGFVIGESTEAFAGETPEGEPL
jgi:hypothetical protein